MSPVLRPRALALGALLLIAPCGAYLLPPVWLLLWGPALLLAAALLPRTRRPVPPSGAQQAGPPDGTDAVGRDGPGSDPAEDAVPGTRVRTVALRSAAADHRLEFSAVVHWRWDGYVDLRLRNPAAPAVHAVVTAAADLAREVSPCDAGPAECELGALLAAERPVPGTGIVTWAEDVRLRLPDADAERLRRLAGLRKDRELWEAIRAAEDGLDPHPFPPTAPPEETGDLAELEELTPFDAGPPSERGPGSDVDEEGYESYWWPAEGAAAGAAAEQDVQVAIVRGLIDSTEEERRADFAREQVDLLAGAGFTEVAHRLRVLFPETVRTAEPDGGGTQSGTDG
ncbi:hypothetical protein [Nocardiopsis sp. CNT312]|uniref:hypothetical protein n=1 Tax=Nocardiopsis sp. CNT312 TaxID=1137268 RepID=UPI0004AE9748|nr:hypothetical protein [Nocardiopsis sp. CNT312]